MGATQGVFMMSLAMHACCRLINILKCVYKPKGKANLPYEVKYNA